MRAINLPHYKIKLRDVSRELYLEHGWDMPRGLQDQRLRDPLSFTREEWQQAQRVGLDPREIKAVFQQCWNASDNRASFEQALKERGFWLAKAIGAALSPSIIAARSIRSPATRRRRRRTSRRGSAIRSSCARSMRSRPRSRKA